MLREQTLQVGMHSLGLLKLAFLGVSLELRAADVALLFRALHVAALPSRTVTICLTPEAVVQRGRARRKEVTRRVESIGGNAWA